MKAILFIHFGSPRNRKEVWRFLSDIFEDHFRFFAKPIAFFAQKAALKKYDAVGYRIFNPPIPPLQKGGEGGFPVYLAAQYGRPSISEILEKIDGDGFERVNVVPLYPHASIEMYDAIAKRVLDLKRQCFRNMSFTWNGPFYDDPLFIEAWANSVRESIAQFESPPHIIFSAHAIQIPPHPVKGRGPNGALRPPLTKGGWGDYHCQVESSANLINQAIGGNNNSSVAFHSAMRRGAWSRPSVKECVNELASKGVLSALMVPVSFLFDNVETLFDIDRTAIPHAFKAGMREVKRATPPGNSLKIMEMITDIIYGASPLCKGRMGGVDLPPLTPPYKGGE